MPSTVVLTSKSTPTWVTEEVRKHTRRLMS